VSADFLIASDGLATGEIDVAFTPTFAVQPGQLSAHAFDEHAAMVVRRDHPALRGPRARLTPKIFNSLPHIDVEVVLGKRGTGARLADQHWKSAGLERDVAFTTPYFTTAAMIAARTDAIAGLPGRLAKLLCEILPLKIVPTSFPLPSMGMCLAWHARTDADAGARFFRELVLAAVKA
jgi:DNA-binding transcriptional LysR family regulator